MKNTIVLDIGTTNIQGILVNASSGRETDYLSIKNSQIVYGEDVITRLGRSLKDPALHKRIGESLKEDLSLLIGCLLERNGILQENVEKIIACGNSPMHHLLLGMPLESLARAPFQPAHKGKVFRTALDKLCGKSGFRHIPFIFLPNIGGFIGSDALCVILDTKMHEKNESTLSIDLGTNGEIMLGFKDKIFVASTSAGPAFEGWRIKCGVYGSTIIDIVSDELRNGTIAPSGFMEKGKAIYRLGSRDIEITQKDVREFQLAKAAISAGIKILMRLSGDRSISRVYITGLFGSRLNTENAQKIGILPTGLDVDKVIIKDRSALLGAKSLMGYKDIDRKLAPVLKKIEHIELHKEPDFQEVFAQAIHF